MKINLMSRKNFNKILFYFFCLTIFISSVNSQCSPATNGCEIRSKFKVYVTAVDKNGASVSVIDKPEFKIIYVFTDRIVFYKTKDQSPILTFDDTPEPPSQLEENIERVVYFGEVILECGGSKNKLCHVEQTPNYEKTSSFKDIKELFVNAQVQCLILPFFESAYKDRDQKIAYICEENITNISALIKFNSYISRKIERFQFLLSMDRYNTFHGILRLTENFMTVYNNQMIPVIGKIYNRKMVFLKNDKTQDFLFSYPFAQQSTQRSGAYIVKDIQGTPDLPNNWWDGFAEEPSPDNCCIYFKGDTENMVLCLADQTGTKVESSPMICADKVKIIYKEIDIPISNIKLYEAYYELLVNPLKRRKCESDEYVFLKKRLEDSADYCIEQDCRTIMQYSKDTKENNILSCEKYYTAEFELEINQITLSNFEVLKGVRTCVVDKFSLNTKTTLSGNLYI
jgi:hypothetical protein